MPTKSSSCLERATEAKSKARDSPAIEVYISTLIEQDCQATQLFAFVDGLKPGNNPGLFVSYEFCQKRYIRYPFFRRRQKRIAALLNNPAQSMYLCTPQSQDYLAPCSSLPSLLWTGREGINNPLSLFCAGIDYEWDRLIIFSAAFQSTVSL